MLLEKVGDNQIIFYIMVAIASIGIVAKIIARMIANKLLREAANIHHSNHPLMKLIKAKYEHANLVTERVQNVEAFVDKFLYEYRVMGIKYYNWQGIEIKCVWLIVATSLLGGVWFYSQKGFGDLVLYVLLGGALSSMSLFLVRAFLDERQNIYAIRTYVVDYLQNVCAHRYAKEDSKEEPMEIQKDEEKKKEEKPTSEILIREILEEFLA